MPEPTRRDGSLLGRLAFRKNRGRVHAPYMIRTVCSPRPMSNLGAKGFRVKLTNRRSPGTGSPRRVAQVQQDKDISMLWRASDLHGFDIKATDGAIGSVDDFLFSFVFGKATRDDPDGEYLKRNRWFESISLQR